MHGETVKFTITRISKSGTVHVEAGGSTTPLKSQKKIPLFEQFKLVLIFPTGTKGHWVEDRIWWLSWPTGMQEMEI